MKNPISSLSIVLPTLNEKENLEILIPSILEKLASLKIEKYEILIVDDGSEDGTHQYIEQYNLIDKNVKLLLRNDQKSLPKSIFYGIKNSISEYVMWLDADGSMDASAVKKLIIEVNKKPESVFVGSRFIQGGGYKGQDEEQRLNIFEYIKKISNSEDSILAILLSKYFNKFIGSLLNIGIKDLTSGFIIGKREYFLNKEVFLNAIYGEYFIYLMKDLSLKNINTVEIPYFCKPRLTGYSKTSKNYLSLLKLSVPYIKAALKGKNVKNIR